MTQPLISICILSYNRPETIKRLLYSIHVSTLGVVEVVICEDKSPRRGEISRVAEEFKETTNFPVWYHENQENLGFDGNLRELARQAHGEWIVYMGDDDAFIPGALDKLIGFLIAHPDLGYVLRSYRLVYTNGSAEPFRYYSGNRFFTPGLETYLELFRKSVFVSGFTIKREFITPFLIDTFDGTLLFQLYLVAEVTLKYPSAYFDTLLTEQYERELSPFFGNSEAEKHLYTPGKVTVTNSVNFMRGFSKIAVYIDKKYHLNSNRKILNDLSKYSYPVLSIQRERGLCVFLAYVGELNKLGLNHTAYYYIYIIGLIFLGKNICDYTICFVKSVLGRTPKL